MEWKTIQRKKLKKNNASSCFPNSRYIKLFEVYFRTKVSFLIKIDIPLFINYLILSSLGLHQSKEFSSRETMLSRLHPFEFAPRNTFGPPQRLPRRVWRFNVGSLFFSLLPDGSTLSLVRGKKKKGRERKRGREVEKGEGISAWMPALSSRAKHRGLSKVAFLWRNSRAKTTGADASY